MPRPLIRGAGVRSAGGRIYSRRANWRGSGRRRLELSARAGTRRHPETPPYRCFLSDLTGFEGLRRAGPARALAASIPPCPRDCQPAIRDGVTGGGAPSFPAVKKSTPLARCRLAVSVLKISERNWLGSAGGIPPTPPFRPPRLEPERKGRFQVFLWRQILSVTLVLYFFGSKSTVHSIPYLSLNIPK